MVYIAIVLPVIFYHYIKLFDWKIGYKISELRLSL